VFHLFNRPSCHPLTHLLTRSHLSPPFPSPLARKPILDPSIYYYTRPMELAPAQTSAATDDLPRPSWSSTPRPTVITSLSTHVPPSTTDHGSFPSSSLSPQSYSSPWLQSPDLTYSDLVAPHQVRIRTDRSFRPLIPLAVLCSPLYRLYLMVTIGRTYP
jgi:hypothetical protein